MGIYRHHAVFSGPEGEERNFVGIYSTDQWREKDEVIKRLEDAGEFVVTYFLDNEQYSTTERD